MLSQSTLSPSNLSVTLPHPSFIPPPYHTRQDGKTIRNRYRCDLDALGVGSRLGLARLADSTLHVYINGEDQGVACDGVPPSKQRGTGGGMCVGELVLAK